MVILRGGLLRYLEMPLSPLSAVRPHNPRMSRRPDDFKIINAVCSVCAASIRTDLVVEVLKPCSQFEYVDLVR